MLDAHVFHTLHIDVHCDVEPSGGEGLSMAVCIVQSAAFCIAVFVCPGACWLSGVYRVANLFLEFCSFLFWIFLVFRVSWQVQYFVDLAKHISWQVQDFVGLGVQSLWQAQDFL